MRTCARRFGEKINMSYECFACNSVFDDNSEAEAKAEYERKYGRPFDPKKVSIVCDACADTAGYTCDLCGLRFMSTPGWSDMHAATEFEEAFGMPHDPATAATLCDDCYKMAMAEFFADQAKH